MSPMVQSTQKSNPSLLRQVPDVATPINSLPPEILSEIFLDIVTTEFDDIYRTRISPRAGGSHSTGSHLGSVCSRWRNVSLRTPALWASFLVRIPRFGYSELYIKRLMSHLKRSSSHPLAVTIFVEYGFTSQEQAIVTSATADDLPAFSATRYLNFTRHMLELIFQHAQRIRSLALTIDSKSDDNAFSSRLLFSLPHHFPVLSDLRVRIPIEEDTPAFLEYFAASSSIHSLAARFCRSMSRISERSRFPFTQITNIELLYASVDTICNVFAHCPNVQIAHLQFFQDSKEQPPPRTSKLSLPTLHTLKIGFGEPINLGPVAELLNDMSFPALSSLFFDMARFHGPCYSRMRNEDSHSIFLKPILHIIASSASNLRTLRFHRVPFNDQHLLSILRKTPNLTELDVKDMQRKRTGPTNGDNFTITVRFLEALTKGTTVPKLRALTMMVWNEWTGKDVLEAMLEARMRHAPRLRSTYVKVVNAREAKFDLGRLRALQEEGLAVRVVQVPDIRSEDETELLGYGSEAMH
ncbi:hypothetical protein Moror_4399 [Moniliophthora roreri MCA 2997]|uniref:Uncharacterized protein n=1 Tax=Moniliophthora roreri (strain MCA 2997) TaxID=1381753 RepID=V2XJB6_MONRO|nr:hypothetical protein Moror_4399 [Moniliophthora roreri MCA 2997]